jgi:hypothetical protein
MRSRILLIMKCDILREVKDRDTHEQGNNRRKNGCHNSFFYEAESYQFLHRCDIEIITTDEKANIQLPSNYNDPKGQYLNSKAIIQAARAVRRQAGRKKGQDEMINREFFIKYSDAFRPLDEDYLTKKIVEIINK